MSHLLILSTFGNVTGPQCFLLSPLLSFNVYFRTQNNFRYTYVFISWYFPYPIADLNRNINITFSLTSDLQISDFAIGDTTFVPISICISRCDVNELHGMNYRQATVCQTARLSIRLINLLVHPKERYCHPFCSFLLCAMGVDLETCASNKVGKLVRKASSVVGIQLGIVE